MDAFHQHRALLFGVAYRLLGSVAEADDLVQETWLRWQRQDATTIASPRAWLVAAITRLGIDQLRSARRRREAYVGVWLPEPIVDGGVPAPDEAAALADSLGMAFLVMLEELAPVERAVFLLREAFDYDYAEIAGIVGKSAEACRKIVSRANANFAQRPPAPATPATETEPIVRRFVSACATGDVGELLAVLTEDAVLYTDGGGRVRSALRPIVTAARIGRFFAGIRKKTGGGFTAMTLTRVNGDIGALLRRHDGHLAVSAFAFAGGRIRAIYTVTNPDKLRHLGVVEWPEAGARISPWRPGGA